jgi:hypothetical protein
VTDPRLARITTAPACDLTHCTQPAATIDGVNGRRCADHPPTYSRDYLRHLIALGMRGTALSYLRAQRPWRTT